MTRLMDMIRKFGAALAVTLALAGCSTPQDARLAEIAPADAIPGPGLWQISDEDTTIYLFGTIHFLPDGVNWYDQRISSAFDASSEFVTEIELGNAAAAALAVEELAMLSDGQTLRGLLSDEDRAEFDEALVSLGMPVETLDMYDPWYAAVNLELIPLMQAGYDPSTGVEMELSERAEGKNRLALETIDQQLGFFDSLPLETQLAYLDGVVESIPTLPQSMDTLMNAWAEGNTGTIVELMSQGMQDGALQDALLVDRNANWAQWIEQRLAQPGDVFVAVGAAHLAGEGSVQAMLAERGHEVTRVWY